MLQPRKGSPLSESQALRQAWAACPRCSRTVTLVTKSQPADYAPRREITNAPQNIHGQTVERTRRTVVNVSSAESPAADTASGRKTDRLSAIPAQGRRVGSLARPPCIGWPVEPECEERTRDMEALRAGSGLPGFCMPYAARMEPRRTSPRQRTRATRQLSPDAELARAFGVGCGLLFLAFLCGWATIAFFWLR